MNDKILKPTHERFCVNYVATGNATDSYRKAFNRKNSGGVHKLAKKLLDKKDIQARIQELQKKTGIVAEDEINKIKKAYGTTVKSQLQLLEFWSNLIVNGENESVKLKASELLAKYHKMFADTNIEVNNNNFAPVQLVVKYVSKGDVVDE